MYSQSPQALKETFVPRKSEMSSIRIKYINLFARFPKNLCVSISMSVRDL